MQTSTIEIGGYFEFGLSNLYQFPYPQAFKYHSARSAFYDLLQQQDIKKIWMPRFICDSMIDPLKMLNVEIFWYDLNEDFYPDLPEKLNSDEFLLYVNYFGLCISQQHKLLMQYPKEQIIFDHSQAFFIQPFDCFATIYSPRKFLAVAEGGLLVTHQRIVPNYNSRAWDEMVEDYQHSFIRKLSTASQGYNVFRKNENKLNDCLPKKMSSITEEILQSFNYLSIKHQRIENFKFLHDQLGGINQLKIDLNQIISPLTYPLVLNTKLADQLITDHIYTPTYWTDCTARVIDGSFEQKMIFQATHLICDQRYSSKEMQFQIDKIQEYLK